MRIEDGEGSQMSRQPNGFSRLSAVLLQALQSATATCTAASDDKLLVFAQLILLAAAESTMQASELLVTQHWTKWQHVPALAGPQQPTIVPDPAVYAAAG
jgi:hypothetical protein